MLILFYTEKIICFFGSDIKMLTCFIACYQGIVCITTDRHLPMAYFSFPICCYITGRYENTGLNVQTCTGV